MEQVRHKIDATSPFWDEESQGANLAKSRITGLFVSVVATNQ